MESVLEEVENDPLSEGIAVAEEEAAELFVLEALELAHLINVVDLGLDSLVHFDDLLFFADLVRIVVALVLGHVATAHLPVLFLHFLLEFVEEPLVDHCEGLD